MDCKSDSSRREIRARGRSRRTIGAVAEPHPKRRSFFFRNNGMSLYRFTRSSSISPGAKSPIPTQNRELSSGNRSAWLSAIELRHRQGSAISWKRMRDCDEALEIESTHFKTLFCKGKVLLDLSKYSSALECFKTALTDQDHDGSHIKGLLINFIHTFWPTLLRVPSFLVEFITPIVKATNKKKNKVLSFYSMPEYESWKESLSGNATGWTIKYYKGLGTSTSKEGKEYFERLDLHKKDFVWEADQDAEAIELAFSKKKIEARKTGF